MDRSSLAPGTQVVRKFWRGGKAYWISGYEVFDPKARHSIKGGFTAIEARRSPRMDQCLVIGQGQIGRPIVEDLVNIQLPRSGFKAYTFNQVYVSFKIQSERVLEGFSFDEVDDLFIGKSE